ncbi:hypothetical protein ACIRD9_42470 [Streptomyces violaceus]|uniref:hypothetical protein n=1 Tax=Streptomyces violaceus TaxID=1936 RepID=UPI003820FEEA
MTDEPQARMNLHLGFDSFGDPLLHMDVTVPDDGALSLDTAEEMAIHMLTTVAHARANAAVARKLMLDGKTPEEVMTFLREVMVSR